MGKTGLEVSVKAQPGIRYRIQFWGARNSDNEGKLLKEVPGTQAAYTLQKGEVFVRAKIISSKLQENPFQDGDYETAWTQPIVAEK